MLSNLLCNLLVAYVTVHNVAFVFLNVRSMKIKRHNFILQVEYIKLIAGYDDMVKDTEALKGLYSEVSLTCSSHISNKRIGKSVVALTLYP